MTIETRTKAEDPCIEGYDGVGTTRREIHYNVALRAARVYTRVGPSFTFQEFTGLIHGEVTKDMARSAGWCHMHPITGRNRGPTSKKKLLNFVLFCSRREIGFHSDHWMKGGVKSKIPGGESAGCIRVPDADSTTFFNSVRDGDCVRLYERSHWREPTFANCKESPHCSR